MTDAPVDFTADAPPASSLDVRWIHGAPASRAADDPPIQVHWYDPHAVILRQSKSVNYEAPIVCRFGVCPRRKAMIVCRRG
jgi:hydroxyacylglutathione hydrolase